MTDRGKVEYRTRPHTTGVVKAVICAAPDKHKPHVLVEFENGTVIDTLVSVLRPRGSK